LTGTDLRKADLTNAKLCDATLTNAELSREAIIVPALEKHKQILLDKTEQVATRHVREFFRSA
jgi:uncharacterized protein YjbI with pentapeptide repeats